MINKFALLLYFGTVGTNPISIKFETEKLCKTEKKRIEKYYYSVGYSNVKGICVRVRE